MTYKPAPEEIQKLREWECTQKEHDFAHLLTASAPVLPLAIICDRCGKEWPVKEET